MKSAGKARNNGLYRHIRTSKEIIRNLLNDYFDKEKEINTPALRFYFAEPFSAFRMNSLVDMPLGRLYLPRRKRHSGSRVM